MDIGTIAFIAAVLALYGWILWALAGWTLRSNGRTGLAMVLVFFLGGGIIGLTVLVVMRAIRARRAKAKTTT